MPKVFHASESSLAKLQENPLMPVNLYGHPCYAKMVELIPKAHADAFQTRVLDICDGVIAAAQRESDREKAYKAAGRHYVHVPIMITPIVLELAKAAQEYKDGIAVEGNDGQAPVR